MKRLIFLCIIFFATVAAAQKGTWSITHTPALIELPNIRYGLQLGGAYDFSSRMQLLTELTVASGKPDEASITESRYFRIKPELRYFIARESTPLRGYVGVQLSFASRGWSNSSSGIYNEGSFSNDSVVSYSSAKIRSPFVAATTQAGVVLKLSKLFSLDGFIGLGAKSVFTSYTSVTNAQKELALVPKCRIMFRPDPAWWVDGTLTRFQFNTGLRLIYNL